LREVQGPSISRQDARFRYSTYATNYRESGLVPCALAAIRALAACTFQMWAFTDFALCDHLIRAGAAVAGYADPEAAAFPVKLAAGYIGAD
jgi:hypothetical protein